jgi:hypothetical protein
VSLGVGNEGDLFVPPQCRRPRWVEDLLDRCDLRASVVDFCNGVGTHNARKHAGWLRWLGADVNDDYVTGGQKGLSCG